MSDDTLNRGPQYASRVNVHEEWEVRYWTKKFDCTKARLEEAVKAVGPIATAVEKYLNR